MVTNMWPNDPSHVCDYLLNGRAYIIITVFSNSSVRRVVYAYVELNDRSSN